MTREDAQKLVLEKGSFRAVLNGLNVEVSSVTDDGKATYRVIRRGRPKFLTEQIEQFVVSN